MGSIWKPSVSYKLLSEVPSKVSGQLFALDPIFISSENGWHSPSDESETQMSLSQWAHTHTQKKTPAQTSKPFENIGCSQETGSSLRSIACREIIVLKEAKRKTRRKNYLQKQNYCHIKMKERLSGSAAICSSAKESLKWQQWWQEPIQHVAQAVPIRSVGL